MSIQKDIEMARAAKLDDDTIVSSLIENPSYGSIIKELKSTGMASPDIIANIPKKSNTITNTGSGLAGGMEATISGERTKGNAFTDYIGSLIKPAVITGGAFVNQASMGLLPDAEKIAPVSTSTEDLQPTNQTIADKAAYGLGALGGNLVAGEGIGKVVGAGAKYIGKPVLNAVTKVFTGMGLEDIANVKNAAPLAEKFREAVWKPFLEKSKKFGEAIDKEIANNPKVSVVLSGWKDTVKNKMAQELSFGDTATKSLVDKSETLSKVISGDLPIDNLNAKEAQILKNKITSELKKGIVSGEKVSSQTRTAPEIMKEFDLAVSESYPGMDKIRGDYRETIDGFNKLKNLVKEGRAVASMRVGGSNDAEIKKLIAEYIPEDVVRQLGGYKKAWDTLNRFKWDLPFMKSQSLGKAMEKTAVDYIPKTNKTFKDFINAVSGQTAKQVGKQIIINSPKGK